MKSDVHSRRGACSRDVRAKRVNASGIIREKRLVLWVREAVMASLVSLAFCRMCHNVTCRRNEIEWDWQGVLVARSIGRRGQLFSSLALIATRRKMRVLLLLLHRRGLLSSSPARQQLTVTRESARGMKRAKAETAGLSLSSSPPPLSAPDEALLSSYYLPRSRRIISRITRYSSASQVSPRDRNARAREGD